MNPMIVTTSDIITRSKIQIFFILNKWQPTFPQPLNLAHKHPFQNSRKLNSPIQLYYQTFKNYDKTHLKFQKTQYIITRVIHIKIKKPNF